MSDYQENTVTTDELRLILPRMSEPYRLAAELSATTALRIGEVLSLRREDVDLGAGIVHVRWAADTSQIVRRVPLPSILVERVTQLVEGSPGERHELLFPSKYRPLYLNGYRREWGRAIVLAAAHAEKPDEFRHKHIHALRRYACESWERHGMPLSVRSALAGYPPSSSNNRLRAVQLNDGHTAIEAAAYTLLNKEVGS